MLGAALLVLDLVHLAWPFAPFFNLVFLLHPFGSLAFSRVVLISLHIRRYPWCIDSHGFQDTQF